MTWSDPKTFLIILYWLTAVYFLTRFAIYAAWSSGYVRRGWPNLFFGWVLVFWPVRKANKYLWPEGLVYLKRARFSLHIFLALLIGWLVIGAALSD